MGDELIYSRGMRGSTIMNARGAKGKVVMRIIWKRRSTTV